MRTIVILSLLLACSSPHSAAPRKYGSFLGPGFVQRPDTLAALSAKAAAGDTVQWDGSKWGAGLTLPVPLADHAAPTAPTSGLDLYSASIAGRSTPTFMNAGGAEIALQPSLAYR
ncbi:MAG TPA: hypothetical protein VFZ25_09365, partial [Chloroflexota bacterium]|nr:hypothetical protein [Chloroflexota bacterium]